MEGTLTCYFRVEKDLYAISARHNFKDGKDDAEYDYNESAPKEVILMSPRAFNDYLISIRDKISGLNIIVDYLVNSQAILQKKVDADPNDGLVRRLAETCKDIAKLRSNINTIEDFYSKVAKGWAKEEDRVIGHVVWAPRIEVSVPPHGYTKDFCIIRLDKAKFKDGFLGNTLSLGPEISICDFAQLMYGRDDVPSEFRYPQQGLAEIRGMLTARQINTPNRKDGEGEPIRRVFKRGMTTKTTVGIMTKFKTLLTWRRLGGVGNGDISDVTYGTLFDWIWDLVKAKFPGADLYFSDLNDFFSA